MVSSDDQKRERGFDTILNVLNKERARAIQGIIQSSVQAGMAIRFPKVISSVLESIKKEIYTVIRCPRQTDP
jgi:hypothetical protein